MTKLRKYTQTAGLTQKELAEIFAAFGAKKLSDIPEDKYGELMKELVKIDG